MICVLRTGDVEVLGEAAAGGRSGDWCGIVGNMAHSLGFYFYLILILIFFWFGFRSLRVVVMLGTKLR